SGPVLMGEALGRSLNVPAIRTTQRVGLQGFLERLQALGFASLDQPATRYGLGLALGNGEVTLLELTQGYGTLARGGRKCVADPIVGAVSRSGDGATASGFAATGERVLSDQAVALVRGVLSDEELRIRAFGANNALMLPFPVAVKTGTSTNWRDSWAIGFTPQYTVGVWVGDLEGKPLEQLAVVSGAGPLFYKVMKRVALRHGQARPEAAPLGEGLTHSTVCATSGLAPTPLCTERRHVLMPTSAVPHETCSHHKWVRLDVRNGLLAGEKCPARFVRTERFEELPAAYASWQEEQGRRVAPRRYSPLCPESGVVSGAVVITWPRKGDTFLIEPGYASRTQTVKLSAEVSPARGEVAWLVDGAEVARAEWPYSARWQLAPGRHRLEAVAGRDRSDPIEFEVR
ncbi:MAG: penicillin-binding transpeptidase domain-containing protein, partial [Myxococcaceae bacterium]